MQNYFTDKRSMIEMSRIIDFCEKLVIKDQDQADANETIESSTKGYELTRVMLRSDRLENYEITVGNIKEIDSDCNTVQDLRKKDLNDGGNREERLLELKRFKVYSDYMKKGEQNLYYKRIYDEYIAEEEPVMTSIEEFMENTNLPFFVAGRMYQNFSILHYKDGILSTTEAAKFKESYNYALNYFMKVCYNKAYKIDNPNYDNLCKLVIIFLAIQRFLTSRMENMDDIDFFDEYSIRNLFLSYGLDYFFDFPLKYQKRILKNINYLIKNKGTTKAIINVLDIFGFDNIKVMKYFMSKEYERDEAGNIMVDKVKLNFYGVDAEETNIEEALKDPEKHTKYEYDEFTKKDKYWDVSSKKDENGNYSDDYKQLINDSFNFIYSKYISIDSFMDLTKFGIDFTNFASLLYYIEDKYKNSDNMSLNKLYFYDYNVSTRKISLFNAILALYSLTMKKYNYVDNIVKSPSAIARVYGFNYDDLVSDVQHFTTKYLLTRNSKLYDLLPIDAQDLLKARYSMYLDNKHYTEDEYSFEDYLNKIAYPDIEENYNFYPFLPKSEKEKIYGEYLNFVLDNKLFEQDYPMERYLEENKEIIATKILSENDSILSFITKDTLDKNEEDFERFLAHYNLDRKEVLVNYFIQQYVRLKMTKEEFETLKTENTDLFNNLAKHINVNTIIENYREFKTFTYLSEKEYDKLASLYDFKSYVDLNDIKAHVDRFLNSSISVSTLENYKEQFSLPDEQYELAENFVNKQLTLTQFKASLPRELSYRSVLAYYYTTKYLTSVSDEFKEKEFKERYLISQDLIVTMCNDFYNGNMDEETFRTRLNNRNLLFSNVYFKYLTYKLLEDGYSTNMEENINMYTALIEKYNFSASMLLDEVEYYRNWNKEGILTKKEVEDFLTKFNTNPMYEFYNKRTMVGMDDKNIDPHTILYLTNDALQRKKQTFFKEINVNKNMDQATFVETFKKNDTFRRELEKNIIETDNYRLFRYYQALHYCCCTSNYRYELFGNYKTFYEYLLENDPYLAKYITECLESVGDTPADRELVFNEYILELCNGIEGYLDDDAFDFFIQGNTILNDYIKDLIYQLVDFIKSYTIQLRDLNTILVFDDKFHNTFFTFEELGFKSEDSIADLESLLDTIQICNSRGVVDVVPTLQDLLKLRIFLNFNDKDENILDFNDKSAFINTDYRSELLTMFTYDEHQTETSTGLLDIMHDIVDSISVDSNFTLKENTLVMLKNFIKNLLNAVKKSDLVSLSDNIGHNNNQGFLENLNLKEYLTATIILQDGSETKIKLKTH